VAVYPAHAGGAARLLADEEPTHPVAIERPGRNGAGDYLNMRGDSVAAWNQPLDELFMACSRQGKAPRPVTVGIGDGGNEIRMGNVRSRLDLLHTPEIERRLIEACVSAGACDGVTRRCEPTVDSLGADIHAGVVDLLRLASRSGIMGGGRAGRRKRS
jgi:D-glutamate cyclase-like, C-terminal